MTAPLAPEGPTGRVALVFTDVQASSTLWEQDPPTMRAALAIHDAALRDQLARHEGYEVRTEGDAFVVAFADPARAVAWCVAAQRALHEAWWPAALLRHREGAPGPTGRGLKVRMGVHVGPVEAHRSPVTGRTDYAGPTVPRGLAVSDAGHGGQILVSAAVREAADLPGLAFTDLGEHRLKGLEGPEHLWQVEIPDLRRTFPPPRSLPNVRTNLPAPPASFLGRDADLAALAALAGPGLVSLVGRQGIGKSRLALRYAADHLAEHGSAGVWLCALGGADSAGVVAQRVARTLGAAMAETPAQVGAALAARPGALVVLDDLETAVAADTVGVWLAAAPDVTFVATVRAPTGLPGERVHPVGPLPTPDALALLRERLRRAPEASEVAALEALAERLGGLPAAIECAALRLDVASAGDLLASAEELALAQSDPAAYAWSALTPREREVLACATRLSGDFDLAAIAAVAGGVDLGPVVARLRATGALAVAATAGGGEPRYRVATRLRGTAAAHLRALGLEGPVTDRAHAWFAGLARALEEGIRTSGAAERTRALGPDAEDLQEAAANAVDAEVRAWATLGASRLAELLGPTSAMRRPVEALDPDALPPGLAARVLARRSLLRARVDPAAAAADARAGLARLGDPADDRLRAQLQAQACADLAPEAQEAALRALLAAEARPAARAELLLALLGLVQVQFRPDADALADEARALAQADGDALGEVQVLTMQGLAATRRGDYARAHALLTASAERASAFGPGRVTHLRINLGLNLEQSGDFAGAEREWREGLHAATAAGQRVPEAVLRNNLGFVRMARGAPALSEVQLRAAVAVARDTGFHQLLGYALSNLGAALAEQGGLEEALAVHAEGWSVLAGSGDHSGIGLQGCAYAATLAHAGRLAEAEAVLGEAAAAYRTAGTPHGDEMVALVRARIGLERARLAVAEATAAAAALAGRDARAAADVAILRRRLGHAIGLRQGEAPTGRIAIVFAGVEAATDLAVRLPDVLPVAARAVERVVRGLLVPFGGYEVRIHATAALAVFAEARSALAYCVEVQRTLLEAEWPARLLAEPEAAEVFAASGGLLFRGLRVRMGLHVGSPEPRPDPVTGRTDYFGPVMNRAARVSAAGHGGQILLSRAAWDDTAAGVGPDLEATDLGVHRLKGLEAPERLIQVAPRELAGRRFAPPRTLDARRTNVPPAESFFAGRAGEVAAADALFQGGSRWITLVGPGGVGKTRLLQHYAASRLDAYGDAGGCWWVELAGAADPAQFVRAVGDVVGASVDGRGAVDDALRALGSALAARGPLLLALDDLDHLEGAGALVAALAEQAPEARILASCRHRLGDPAEVVLEVGPLPADDAAGLVVARAREQGAPLADAALAEVATELADRLRGLPLALELAAADLRTRDPAAVLADVAREGASSAAAVIDAALHHAGDAARDALAQLAAFRAPFPPDAAAAVAVPRAGSIAPALAELRERGLVRPVPGDLDGRLAVWPNVRPHARAALAARPDRAAVAARHAAWAVGVAEDLVAALETADGSARVGAFTRLAAHARELEPVLAGADPAAAARAALALHRLYRAQGPADREARILDEALARAADLPAALADALGRARAAIDAGEADPGPDGLPALREAAERAVALGERRAGARLLARLARALAAAGRGPEAEAAVADGLALARESGDRRAEEALLAAAARSAT